MKHTLAIVGIPVLGIIAAFGSHAGAATSQECTHEARSSIVDVTGLQVGHYRVLPANSESVFQATEPVAGTAAYAEYLLKIVTTTQRRSADPGNGCSLTVYTLSDRNLVDLEITSNNNFGDVFPAGSSLNDLFNVTVGVSIRNNVIPDKVFNPRNRQTVSQYLSRIPIQPLVLDLKLNQKPSDSSAHVFTVLMYLADGNILTSRSGAVILTR